MSDSPKQLFAELRKRKGAPLFNESTHEILLRVVEASFDHLSRSAREGLFSKVQGKTYFRHVNGNRSSRAINGGLYNADSQAVIANFGKMLKGDFSQFSAPEITKTLYSAAISFCASVDLMSQGDQKTPGTYFEYFCAHLLRAVLKVTPLRSLQVLTLDLKTNLPTDLIFDLGENRPKFHAPVKTSTRERIVQVFAHQRMLDGVYGTGRFLGLPMVLTETKSSAKGEVIEICLPDQFRLYHLHVAQFWRMVYFDMPESYRRLATVFPPIPVIEVGELFHLDGPLAGLLAGTSRCAK